MVNRTEREAQELNELNLALDILRNLADREGYVIGSPVERIYSAFVKDGRNIPLSRVRMLVGRLGELGWREEAWIGSGNVRGSKITLLPEKIQNLEVLPAKAEREKFEEEVATWVRRHYKEVVGRWTITNPSKLNEKTVIEITSCEPNKPRGQKSHWVFRLNKAMAQPQWLESMLNSDGTMADSALYLLWKANNAELCEGAK